MKTVSWQIDGMRCSACARTIQTRLMLEPGVRHAEVRYPAGAVRLLLDDADVQLDPVIALLQQAGYRVLPVAPAETPERTQSPDAAETSLQPLPQTAVSTSVMGGFWRARASRP